MKRIRDKSRVNLNEFVKSRRAASNFDESVLFTPLDLREILDVVRYAPSSYNLQPVRYIVYNSRDREKRDYLKKINAGQHKIITASAIIAVVGITDAYKNIEEVLQAHKENMDTESYENWISSAKNMYKTRGDAFSREDAIRNASLSAMTFMLVAKNMGWDTCPMVGYEEHEVSSFFKLNNNEVPVMLIAIGKQPSNYLSLKRPTRKNVDDFFKFI